MGAGQSILEGDEECKQRNLLSESEIKKLLESTIFKPVVYDEAYYKEMYKAYSDPDKLNALRDYYYANLQKT